MVITAWTTDVSLLSHRGHQGLLAQTGFVTVHTSVKNILENKEMLWTRLYSLRLSLSQHTHLLQSPYLWFFVLFCLFIRKQSQTSNYELWNIFIFLTVTIKFSLKCMLFYVICFHTMFLCKSAYDYNLLPLVRCSLRTHCIITQCPMHGVFFFFFLFKSKFYSDSEAGRKIINLVKNHIPS